jgi:hypothetical protein
METNYDLELNKVNPPLHMLPWIGPDYENTGILFIAESDYSDGVKFDINWKRKWIVDERIITIKRDTKLLNNIDKTILGDRINETTQKKLWKAVAFTNVVQRPMDKKGKKVSKPIDRDFQDGWNTMLQVIVILKPKMIIKWGIAGHGTLVGKIHQKIYKGWSQEQLEPNGRFLKLKHESGFTTQILFMHHPSYRFFKTDRNKDRIVKYLPQLSKI